MNKKGEYFAHIFEHYMSMLLATTDAGSYANIEIERACNDLLEALNPKVTIANAEESTGPFYVCLPTITKNYSIRHKATGQIISEWRSRNLAHEICNWLNERYER